MINKSKHKDKLIMCLQMALNENRYNLIEPT